MSIARSVLRVFVALVSAALCAALLSFATVPDAAANHGETGFDYFVGSNTSASCAETGAAFGFDLTKGGSSFTFNGFEVDRCIFAPSSRITTETQCIAAGGLWNFFDGGLCYSGAAAIELASFAAGVCPAGFVGGTFADTDWCLLPLRTSHVAGASAVYKPICIEDSMLQGDETLARLRVNSEIHSDASTTYFVQSGAGCTFDCADGFDVNCDGKFGDYCRVEIDRKSVAGAGQCIAESGPAVQPLPPVEATPVSTEAPTTLAHTGSEESVAMIGFWLVGAGATALMVRRRRNS